MCTLFFVVSAEILLYQTIMALISTDTAGRHGMITPSFYTVSYVSVVQPDVVVVVNFAAQLRDDICFIQLLQDRRCAKQIG